MIKNSFKQLFRKPGKALLFFCLMAAATMLMVFGASMYFQSVARIKAAKAAVTTIGYVGQAIEEITSSDYYREDCPSATVVNSIDMVYGYGDTITPGQLMFEGAPYVAAPESRPYYVVMNEDLKRTEYFELSEEDPFVGVEFTLKEDTNGWEPVEFDHYWQVYLHDGELIREEYHFSLLDKEGIYATNMGGIFDEIEEMRKTSVSGYLCQHNLEVPLELKAGVKYIGALNSEFFAHPDATDFTLWSCPVHDKVERVIIEPAHSSRCDRQGNLIDPAFGPAARVDEVTDGFYETGRGRAWINRGECINMRFHAILATAPRAAELLPSYRQGKLRLTSGRMITPEEFEDGARVCLVSRSLAARNLLYEGDKVRLPLLCSMYNTQDIPYSLLDVDGEMYEPFWDEEYEIVGFYDDSRVAADLANPDIVVIPYNSVAASDENNIAAVEPMQSWGTVFQLENGTVEEFDAALRAAFPDAERLNITYDDNGYDQVMKSMEGAQRTALLLFAVGVLAALAIVVLLMYFFIVREKKRTAVERSLGFTKRQCRVSLLAGLMVLTIAAAALGSALGGVLLEHADSFSAPVQEEETGTQIIDWGLGGHFNFSSKFSLWPPRNGTKADLSGLEEISPPAGVYLAVPVFMCVLVLVLAVVLVNRSLKIEPILLLSVKT